MTTIETAKYYRQYYLDNKVKLQQRALNYYYANLDKCKKTVKSYQKTPQGMQSIKRSVKAQTKLIQVLKKKSVQANVYYTRWSIEELKILVVYKNEKKTQTFIADKLKRSSRAIFNKWSARESWKHLIY